jgi:hypothetical protein
LTKEEIEEILEALNSFDTQNLSLNIELIKKLKESTD